MRRRWICARVAQSNRYADATRAAATGAENLQSGRWTVPIGSLVIVDDADQLPARQLRWLTGNAAVGDGLLGGR
jgi:hypothetical protein